MLRPSVLFICKSRASYTAGWPGFSSGLQNSVRFVVEVLTDHGVAAEMVEVRDNNEIDRVVTERRPTLVVVEALWVVPEKFDVLHRLHPRVAWAVRLHSELPFLAQEGVALEWVRGYLERGVEVACNSGRLTVALRAVAASLGLPERLVGYLPNCYPVRLHHRSWVEALENAVSSISDHERGRLDIGCFGAIRPLKNHLLQAVAALAVAQNSGQRLRFHVNAARVEAAGDPVLRNLRALLGSALVEHGWLPHEEFCKLLARMDMSMQVSLSETFNIVSADAVATGVPTVVSGEVGWLGDYARADPTSERDVVRKLEAALEEPRRQRVARQRADLARYEAGAEAVWLDRLA